MARLKCPKCPQKFSAMAVMKAAMKCLERNEAKAALQKCPKCPQKAAMKCSKVKKAMKVAECSKVKKAMKVAECSTVKKAMKAMEDWKVAMKAAKVAMKVECSKLKKAMKVVECLKAKNDEMKPTMAKMVDLGK